MSRKNGIRKNFAVLFLLGFLLLLSRPSLFAQSNSGASAGTRRGDAYTLKLALMGPGDELYFWFGHIALVVEDKTTGQARFYDWGVFSFDTQNFFVNFAFGRLWYSCMVSRADLNYNEYIRTNRDITLYTLDLPADKKEEIVRFAENNVLPQNRNYAYHHFRDNCSTRIRDIIDMGVDGQFKDKYGDAPGRFTLRQHVRRHTWAHPFFDWALNFWMGQDIDRPITIWDEMFLPSELAMRVKDFHYIDESGKDRALVSSVETLNTSHGRPLVLDKPRLQWPRELIVSCLFSGLAALCCLFLKYGKAFRIFLGMLQSLLGLFFGIMGSLLFFMSFFTNHDYTYHNSNILFVNPLFFAAIPLGINLAFSKDKKKRFIVVRLLRVFWLYVLLGGLLTMAIKLFPEFYQQNQVDQALVLPIALVMIFLMTRAAEPAKNEAVGKMRN